MKPIILWIFGICVVVSILSLTFFGMWDSTTFFVISILTVVYLSEFSYINYVKKIQIKKKMEEEDLYYIFNKVNEALKRFHGGDTLTWGGGINRNISTRTYKIDGKNNEYIAIFAETEKSKIFVNIIYGLTEKRIRRYEGTYDADILKDPFHNFDPKNEEPHHNPFDRYSRYKDRRILPYGRDKRPEFDGSIIDSVTNEDSTDD